MIIEDTIYLSNYFHSLIIIRFVDSRHNSLPVKEKLYIFSKDTISLQISFNATFKIETVKHCFFLIRDFIIEKTCSIGFRSGE